MDHTVVFFRSVFLVSPDPFEVKSMGKATSKVEILLHQRWRRAVAGVSPL